MASQHLSDEAVAAFADGVLGGLARERATRHIDSCVECRQAVKVQREAAFALRTAPPPALPTGLFDRLRSVPETTPIVMPPTVLAPDGSTMLATFAPVAALVPPAKQHRSRKPIVTTAAVVALAGLIATGSAVASDDTQSGTGHPTHMWQRTGDGQRVPTLDAFMKTMP